MVCTKLLKKHFLFATAALLLFVAAVFPQDYPKKIRGYKVFQTDISVKSHLELSSDEKAKDTVVRLGEPELTDISLTGITLEISAEIEGLFQNGKVDFLAFEDFKVNGLDVEIEEYREPFDLVAGQKTVLPKPVKIFLGTGQALRGAHRELKSPEDEWPVSGRLFVFGRFKKFGFSFKRVVPVEINIRIENPVKKKLAQSDLSK